MHGASLPVPAALKEGDSFAHAMVRLPEAERRRLHKMICTERHRVAFAVGGITMCMNVETRES